MFYIYVVLVISICYQCVTVTCYRSIFSFFIPVVGLCAMYSCRVCPKFQYSIIFVIIAHYEVGYTILTKKYYNGTN